MSTEDVYDLVGLGFGPANIAIAGALTEKWQQDVNFPIKKTLFVERHEVFRWHPGMLLPDAKMQISFMKDLATLRNPASPYTFLNYLHSEDRLISFINRGSTIPTRKEYSDYLSWAANKVQQNGISCLFGHEIIGLDDAPEDTIRVRYRNLKTGAESTIRTRDFIVSPGGLPRVPDFIEPFTTNPRVIHSSAYALKIGDALQSLSGLSRPLRIGVVGSGQSAAEVAIDVRNRLANVPAQGRHAVEMLIRKGSLKPSDDSPFANEIFDPASTDAWFSTPSKTLRERILSEYKQTNYGVVNPRTLETLYEIIYDQKLNSAISQRTKSCESSSPVIVIKPYTSISSIEPAAQSDQTKNELLLTPEGKTSETEQSFVLSTKHTISGTADSSKYDIILYATGYQRNGWVNLLKHTGIGKHFGLSPSTSNVTLRPSTDLLEDSGRPQHFSNGSLTPDETPSPVSDSAVSTPPTSPENSVFSSARLNAQISHDVYLSRSYQLLPLNAETPLVPRIYLQGVEEATHGLSDTLLSVLGVRSGEVVADLAKGYKV
ncbi:lysine/ornithine N-monooxygenase [Coprinopsis marcescibilis]|uniref:L-ornithine N(5)-monooxygenase [NAD(P)H] n=1 Tax=Coprinopsis marcescibilis TaxID=230819 RepID=A0A5C3LAW6_COPMA|nr:lysine/ornithine N-monooxygenase [Coprinopsis marcescibilis]